MFDQVFDNFRKATETTLQAQQDLFRQWMSQWPIAPHRVTDASDSQGQVTEQVASLSEAVDRQRHGVDDPALRSPGRTVPGRHPDNRGCASDHRRPKAPRNFAS